MTCAILRVDKIKSRDQLTRAARHNLRTIPVDGVEETETGHPAPMQILVGTENPAEIRHGLDALLRDASISRPRRDAVLAIEFLISASDREFEEQHAFFSHAASWLSARFGGQEHLLSAVVHRDEPQLHMHMLQVPLIGGRLVGSDAIGGPAQLRALIDAFQHEVCAAHGLTPVPCKVGPVMRQKTWRALMSKLHETKDPIVHSAIWPEVQAGLRRDPIPAATLLGLDLASLTPKKRMRSSTSIFISKGKGSHVGPAS